MPDSHDDASSPLAQIRIVVVDAGIAGGYLGRLFTDAGAEVVHIEPPGGTALRHRSARVGTPSGALYRHLTAGTTRLVVDPREKGDIRQAARVVTGSDAVVLDRIGAGARPTLTIDQVMPWCAGRVLAQVSLWGMGHRDSERAGTEFTLQAAVGGTGGRGRPESPPLAAGGERGIWHTGAYSAVGVLAALGTAPPTRSVVLDVSAFECMVTGWNPYEWIRKVLYDPPRDMRRWTDVPSIERAKDGWVGISVVAPDQWRAYCDMTGASELAEDPTLSLLVARSPAHERIRAATGPWLTAHTVDEIVAAAAERRIPAVRVGPASALPQIEHFQLRRTFLGATDELPQRPAPPYLIDGVRRYTAAPVRDAPPPSEQVWSERSSTYNCPALDFAGLAVLDVSAYWAGPYATQVLAVQGADVVHVESAQRYDAMRNITTRPRTDKDWWEFSCVYQGAQAGKRSLALDLSDVRGRDVLHRLMSRYDVVVENFSPDTAPKLGLVYEELAALSPGLILVRMPGFGLTGPWSHHRAFAMTGDQISGLALRTGWPDDRPTCPRTIGDSFTGLHAAFAVMAALRRRARTGQGAFIEVSSIEVSIMLASEEVVESNANGIELGRVGNRSEQIAPQGVYAASGDDEWVALSVDSDASWREVVRLAGLSESLPDAESWQVDCRIARHSEIDDRLTDWFSRHEAATAVNLLQERGVAAEVVVLVSDLDHNETLRSRRFFFCLAHPVAGSLDYAGLPWQVDGVRRGPLRPAPLFGQDTEDVLLGIGLSADDIAGLTDDGVIGGSPPLAQQAGTR
jgi:crotonobetainyl-CoA:carnitine CoA-transferase CaiB-like acyl-CoA transferase